MINWDMPLLIKGTDNQEHEVNTYDTGSTMLQGDGTINKVLICHIDGWEFKWVASHKGEDRLGIMPRVYNKKPVPKEGEWWMCEITNTLLNRPKRKDVIQWMTDFKLPNDHITPLWQMKRVEG